MQCVGVVCVVDHIVVAHVDVVAVVVVKSTCCLSLLDRNLVTSAMSIASTITGPVSTNITLRYVNTNPKWPSV